jgi:predicted nucleic acid-binding protein
MPRADANDQFTEATLEEWYRGASAGGRRDQRIRQLIDEIRRLRSERDHARSDMGFEAQLKKRHGPRGLGPK